MMCRRALEDAENSYLQSFLTADRLIQSGNVKDVLIAFHADHRPAGEHQGRFNLPSVSEVAILMPNDARANNKRIVCSTYIQQVGDGGAAILKYFDDTHRSYDPLQYPLIFPQGTDGWNLSKSPTTLKQFTAYHLMVRSNRTSYLHLSRRLFQQHMIDMYCKAEIARMKFVIKNQKELRADLYSGADDAIMNGDLDRTGTKVVLPSSVTGSPRYMNSHYQDAMAITRHFGKPTFFITMTANGNWKEIKEQLKTGETYHDRPDIVARVFQ